MKANKNHWTERGRAASVSNSDAIVRPRRSVPSFGGGDQVTTAKSLTTKLSESAVVEAYMKGLRHPLADVVEALRQIILKADLEIGEEIKWNAPAFFYTGEMQPFDPKEYKRHLVVFNLFKKDCIRPVFWGGAKADDKSGFLEGDYADGRRLAKFHDLKEVTAKKKALQRTLKLQLKHLDK